MRIALIADVHGNLPALEAVLRALADEGCDRIMCAGDLVGYGPFPNECVARIAGAETVCVAGNHDLMAVERLDEAGAGRLALETLAWTRGVLGADARAYLESLPMTVEAEGLAMGHGSLDDPRVYVEAHLAGDELRRLAAARPDAAFLVLGHTHRPLAHGERRGTLLDGRAGEVEVAGDERLLVNPGTVGQPREWRPLARYAVLDTGAGTVGYRSLSYDTTAVRDALIAAGLPPDACHRRPPLRRVARRALGRLSPRLIGH